MDRQTFSPKTTVADALAAAPDIPRSFIAHRTACVGCALARFCTLADVAIAYGFPLDAFLDELQHAVIVQPPPFTGAHHEESL